MYAANAYTIRMATDEDAREVRRVAELDSEARELTGRILIGEIDGAAVAAYAVDEGRVVADPFKRTATIVAHLRRRAAAMHAVDAEPALRRRIRAGLRVRSAAA